MLQSLIRMVGGKVGRCGFHKVYEWKIRRLCLIVIHIYRFFNVSAKTYLIKIQKFFWAGGI